MSAWEAGRAAHEAGDVLQELTELGHHDRHGHWWREADGYQVTGDDDHLAGGEGDDLLLAQRGDDVLAGGDDADYLVGGGDHDRLAGGPGGDRVTVGHDTSARLPAALAPRLIDWSGQYQGLGDAAGLDSPSPWLADFALELDDAESDRAFVIRPVHSVCRGDD
jgi:Ca2+-binding RTX toxin-like protein